MTPRDLRVGIVFDSVLVPAWIWRAASQIRDSAFIQCVDFVLESQDDGSRAAAFTVRLRTFASNALFSVYERLDYLLFKSRKDALAVIDIGAELPKARKLDCSLADQLAFDASAVLTLQAARLDVLLWLSDHTPPREILRTARYGVWAFRHGESRTYTSLPALFWEIYDQNPVSSTTLEILDENPEHAHVIYRSWSATDQISLYRTRNAAYWKTASFASRRLRDLHRRGWDYIRTLPTYDEPRPSGTHVRGTPSNLRMIRYLGRVLTKAVWRQVRSRLYTEEWFVAYRTRGEETPSSSARTFQVIAPPSNRSIMDPFIIQRDGREFVLCEDYSPHTQRGVIAWFELIPSGSSSAPEVALERNHHLSYPFILEWNDGIFMVPETASAGKIELYRAKTFPSEWMLEKVLMSDVVAFDATIVEYAGKFWLFASMPEDGARINDELSLFYSDSPVGDWTPHPMNPVVSDVRRARPAGRIFSKDGSLVRPGQDCSMGYGYAVVFNCIDVLSETDYRETEIGRIDPNWMKGNVGTHSYNFSERYEIIDGRRERIKIRSVRLR
jgi:hypothetical protein